MPITLKQLRDAHIERHRVGRSLEDLSRLNKAERAIFRDMQSGKKIKLTRGTVSALLEPRRFGVNWHQEFLKTKGGRAKAKKLEAAAKKKTARARKLFDDPVKRWTPAARKMERLVIEGH